MSFAVEAFQRFYMEYPPEEFTPTHIVGFTRFVVFLLLAMILPPVLIAVEAVIPDLLEVKWQDVLDRTADELVHGHRLILIDILLGAKRASSSPRAMRTAVMKFIFCPG